MALSRVNGPRLLRLPDEDVVANGSIQFGPVCVPALSGTSHAPSSVATSPSRSRRHVLAAHPERTSCAEEDAVRGYQRAEDDEREEAQANEQGS
jgi:hypothetical protein